MNNIKLTKANVILSCLFLVALIMLPLEFIWSTTGIELLTMEKDYFLVQGLLLWIFLAAQLITAILGFVDRYDLALFTSLIGLVGILLAGVFFGLQEADGGFFSRLNIGYILCCVIGLVTVIISAKEKKN